MKAMSILWPSLLWSATMRAVSLLVLLLPLAAAAQDSAPGRALYETYCGGCHYERVHDRLRTEVKDLSDLRDMVARWAAQTKRTYTPDELESIVQYLNQTHYRFGLSSLPRRGGR
jgi:mono/diheme cytochrome c family protein